MPLIFSRHDLHTLNTLALPARASFATLRDESDIDRLLAWIAGHRPAPTANGPREEACTGVFVLGGGSNVVVQPLPQHGVVQVALHEIRLWRETATHWVVEAAAGESWHGLVRHCLEQGWPGLENLALIPGTVGAAPVQNIGAYGLELSERLHSVVAWDLQSGQCHEFTGSDCGFAYRDSRFKRDGPGRWLISRVRLALPKAWRPCLSYADLRTHASLRDWVTDATAAHTTGAGTTATWTAQAPHAAWKIFDAVCDIRRRKLPDPATLPNAGSFFKNPVVEASVAHALSARHPDLKCYPQDDGRVKLAAGWLIEQAGWKGRRLGPVGMHAHQALVLVNYGAATAADVGALARAVREDVRARFGVVLEQEPVDLT